MTAGKPASRLDELVREVWSYPLLGAIFGRRARRFARGMEIAEGAQRFKSRHEPVPLTQIERALIFAAGAGVTGWNFGIARSVQGGRDVAANYSTRYTGRSFPSPAAIHSAELFITDDSGTYLSHTRDVTPAAVRDVEQLSTAAGLVDSFERHTERVSDGRLDLPREAPHVAAHNRWNANVEGSTLFLPVADVAQQLISIMAISMQQGAWLYDDDAGQPCGDLDRFFASGLLNERGRTALAGMEQNVLTITALELATMGQNMVLLLQAMGLGGWLFTGLNQLSVLGAFAPRGVRGLGFRFQRFDDRPAAPNPVGLDGHYEALCPPYFDDMHAAVRQFVDWKFAPGGAYDPSTAGPFSDSASVKGETERYSDEFVEALAVQAQYVFERFGKFPATIPSILMPVYVQAQHIDTEFYDAVMGEGAYLESHAEHMSRWHDLG